MRALPLDFYRFRVGLSKLMTKFLRRTGMLGEPLSIQEDNSSSPKGRGIDHPSALLSLATGEQENGTRQSPPHLPWAGNLWLPR